MLRFADWLVSTPEPPPPTPIPTFTFKNEKRTPPQSPRRVHPPAPSLPAHLSARPPPLHYTVTLYRTQTSPTEHARLGLHARQILFSWKEGRGGAGRGDAKTEGLFSIRIPPHGHAQASCEPDLARGYRSWLPLPPAPLERRFGPRAAAEAELWSASNSKPTTKFSQNQPHALRLKREGGSAAL